jgi:hypothetical protein
VSKSQTQKTKSTQSRKEGTMNRVEKRGNKNENKDGSDEGNNIEEERELNTTECSSNDSYPREFRLEMEAAEKFKKRQDKILYQKELLKERKLEREEKELKIRK